MRRGEPPGLRCRFSEDKPEGSPLPMLVLGSMINSRPFQTLLSVAERKSGRVALFKTEAQTREIPS
jgi:hypothetical protein